MKIKIAPGTLLLTLLLALQNDVMLPTTLLAALFHELGHLLAARLLHIRIARLEIDLLGAKLYPAGLLPSFGAEFCLAVAGPLASLLLPLCLYRVSGKFAAALSLASLSLALFNLLPIGEFDGGRMLHATLSAHLADGVAHRVLSVTTYLSLLFLFCLSSCLLLRYGQNLSLAVLSATLFAKFFLTD
ncbi:MAG: M50 family metallopeptidase [Clostridia bacterium]|nr:M50 family metallopeptidase [Clostridia bacterium]